MSSRQWSSSSVCIYVEKKKRMLIPHTWIIYTLSLSQQIVFIIFIPIDGIMASHNTVTVAFRLFPCRSYLDPWTALWVLSSLRGKETKAKWLCSLKLTLKVSGKVRHQCVFLFSFDSWFSVVSAKILFCSWEKRNPLLPLFWIIFSSR